MTDSEFRAKRKKAHVCTQCGKEDAYTMMGRSRCADCAEVARKSCEKARQDPVKYRKILDCNLNKKYRRKEAGLCPRCGKPTNNGRVHCEECLKKERMRYKRNKEYVERGEYGKCYICNKREAIPGKRLCEECYERNLKQFESVRQKGQETMRKSIEGYWKLKKAGMA